ncbi:hypothetical protein K1719_007010 [Acacia pycnantha]|nr:hypothetical protein K1719_007010 [Acacia pycnantha]
MSTSSLTRKKKRLLRWLLKMKISSFEMCDEGILLALLVDLALTNAISIRLSDVMDSLSYFWCSNYAEQGLSLA